MSKDNKYPIYKKGKEKYSKDIFIVRFDSEIICQIVFSTEKSYPEGEFFNHVLPHTDDIWEDIAYNEELGLFDTQPVARMKGSSMIIDFYDINEKGIVDFIPFSCLKPEWLIEEYRKKYLF